MSIEKDLEDMERYDSYLRVIRELLEIREEELVKEGLVPTGKISSCSGVVRTMIRYNPERMSLLKKDEEYKELLELRKVYSGAGKYLSRRLAG